MKLSKEVKEDLVGYVKQIKKQTNVGLHKHYCDHLLWLIEET